MKSNVAMHSFPMWPRASIAFIWSLTLFLGACGSSSKPGAGRDKKVQSGDVLRSLDCSGSGGGASDAGDEALLGLTTADSVDLRHVPAEDLVVAQGEAPVSLCEIMRANGDAQLGLFMFTSPSCYNCQKWIEKIGSSLGDFGNKVLPVAIVVASTSVLTEASLEELKEQVAKDVIWVRDPAGEVWDFFATQDGTGLKVNPLVLEMDAAARGLVVEDTELGTKELVDRANETLGLEVGSGS